MSGPKLPDMPALFGAGAPPPPAPEPVLDAQDHGAQVRMQERGRLIMLGANAALTQLAAQVQAEMTLTDLTSHEWQYTAIAAGTAAASIALEVADHLAEGTRRRLAEVEARLERAEGTIAKLEERVNLLEAMGSTMTAVEVQDPDLARFVAQLQETAAIASTPRRAVRLAPGEEAPSVAGHEPPEGHRWETDAELCVRVLARVKR